MSTTPQNNADGEKPLRWYHAFLCCGAKTPIASEPGVELELVEGNHQDNPPDPQSSSLAVEDTVVQRTKLALRSLEKALGAVPIVNLSSIPALLLIFLEQYEKMATNAEELQDLLRQIEELKVSMLEPSEYLDVDARAILERPVEGFRTKLMDLNAQLERVVKVGAKKYIDAGSVSKNLNNIKSSLDQAIRDLTANAVVAIACSQAKSTALAILDKLNVAKATHPNVLKEQCMEYTRVDIRKRIAAHLSKGDPRFVWLKGSPGQGKTAIAMSLCRELEGNHRLAASFFFDKTRNNHSVDSTDHFVSSLAYQLANFDSRYRQSLIRCLRSESNILDGPLSDQLQSLIIKPMREAYEGRRFEGPTSVIVIDGLDECSEKSPLDKLMNIIIGRGKIRGREGITGLSGLPNHFVFLVSSRPEPEIQSAWEREKTHIIETLDDDDAKPDIRSYVIQHLTDHFQYDVAPPEAGPPEHDMAKFANLCGGLFLVAQIRVREVKQSLEFFLEPSIEAFGRILSDAPEVKEVDEEYLRIFRAYLRKPLQKAEKDRFRSVMSAVLDLQEPLSVRGISQLLGDGESRVRAVLNPISSVLDAPPTKNGPVRFYHATTGEFLQRPKFWEDHPKEKEMLFFPDVEGFLSPHCLRVLRENRLPQLHTHSNPADLDTHFSNFRARFKDTMADKTGSHIRYAVFNFFDHAHRDVQDLCAFINEILPSWILLGSFAVHLDVRYLGGLTQVFSDSNQKLEFGAKQFLCNLFDVAHHIPPISSLFQQGRFNAHLLRTTLIPFMTTPRGDSHLSQYLDNRVRVFSVHGEFGRWHIPISRGVLQSYRGLLPHFAPFRESVVSKLRPYLDGGDVAWLEAHKSLQMLDIKSFRPCIVDCSALSANGGIVALAFGDGGIEISYVERTESSRFLFQPNSPPLWMEFILGDSHIILEDSSNILWLTNLIQCTPEKVSDALPSCHSVVRAVDSKRQMIVRAPRSDGTYHWSEQMHLIHIDTPDIHVRHLNSPELDGSQSAGRNKMWPYSRSVGFSPNAVHVGAFDDNELYVWSTETAAVVARDHVAIVEHQEEPVAPWMLNRGIPDDSPICDSLHPSMTTTAFIRYKRSYGSHRMRKKERAPAPNRDLSRPDLQSAAFIRITEHNLRLEHDRNSYIKDAIARLYQEGCDPYVDWRHHLRLGKFKVFSVMNTFMPLNILDVKRNDGEYKGTLCDAISEYWWIEKAQRHELFFFVPHSADGKRILLKGKAFAPVLVDISGFLSYPLHDSED